MYPPPHMTCILLLIQVSAGAEPANFTCHFLGWDSSKAKKFEDPYEAKMKALKDKASEASSSEAPGTSLCIRSLLAMY
jgi:hypothetical protein